MGIYRLSVFAGKILYLSLFFFFILSNSACKTTRFDVNPDVSDHIYYSFGSGEAGGDYIELEVRGDGEGKYRYRFPLVKEKEVNRTFTLVPSEVKTLFQGLVDDGLFDLKDEIAGGADMDWVTISAKIDGREVKATFTGDFGKIQEIRGSFLPLLKRAHPEKWGKAEKSN